MRRHTLLLVVLLLAACSNPAEPSDSIDGQWVGTYHIRSCTQEGWPTCVFDASLPHSLLLRISQTGQHGSGTIQIEDYQLNVPVTGRVLADTISVTGSALVSNTKAYSVRISILGWTIARQNASTMLGTFRLRVSTTWGIASSLLYPTGETWMYDYDADVVMARR